MKGLMTKKLHYINKYNKIPQKYYSKVSRRTLINLAFFWYPVTPTIYPPFPFSLKNFPQA